MLEEITIENLGVISRAQIPLSAGLTAITGETGAGKTMLLTGLDLLMGGKADPSRVRTGASQACAEGRIVVPADSAVAKRVAEAGGALDDDDTLVILRTMAAAGRSRGHLGGRSVPQAVLAEIAEDLVTVHGQSDQLRLKSPSRQREALDAFAGVQHAKQLARYRAAWTQRQTVSEEINQLITQREDREREAEHLRRGLADVERINPAPGEDAELDQEIARLSNVEELRAKAAEAYTALSGDEYGADDIPSAVALVDVARRGVEHAGAHDLDLAALAQRLTEVALTLGDISVELADYLGSLSSDPARLEAAFTRRAELSSLTRLYGDSIDEVLQWASVAGLRLLELEGGDERLAALKDHLQGLETKLTEVAAIIRATRTASGKILGERVSAELDGLAMAGAVLVVSVEPADQGPSGADAVSMGLIPHSGAPLSPLGKGASGGELSRVMLAIEVVLAHQNHASGQAPPTFVFDEVDAGIGGRAAMEVGRRLAELARTAQVIVVTHLAQVAAYADSHVVVSKSSDSHGDVVTQSDVRVVQGEDRLTELARMLSGQDESEAARAHAAELLAAAHVG